jgi:hypothetical protein
MSCVCARAPCVRACVDAHQHIVEVRAGVVPFGGGGGEPGAAGTTCRPAREP